MININHCIFIEPCHVKGEIRFEANSTFMTIAEAAALWPILKHFAETGRLPEEQDDV